MDAIEFVKKILTIACLCNFSVTSWIRSYERNKKVGGSEYSLHLLGCAVDVVPDTDRDLENIKHYCDRLGLEYIEHKDHIHIQLPHKE